MQASPGNVPSGPVDWTAIVKPGAERNPGALLSDRSNTIVRSPRWHDARSEAMALLGVGPDDVDVLRLYRMDCPL